MATKTLIIHDRTHFATRLLDADICIEQQWEDGTVGKVFLTTEEASQLIIEISAARSRNLELPSHQKR